MRGKEGKIYLVDRDNMGRFNAGSDTNVQSLANAVGGVRSSPAYFNNQIYYQGSSDVMRAFLITNGMNFTTNSGVITTNYCDRHHTKIKLHNQLWFFRRDSGCFCQRHQ